MSFNTVISKFSKYTNIVCFSIIESPVGKIIAAADDDYLYIVAFEDTKNLEKVFETVAKERKCRFIESKNKILLKFEEEISDYFNGKLTEFTVPIKYIGTDFQKAVWDEIQKVPFGSTQTYGDVASALGRAPSHSRAIGAACGANPLLMVVPCHRLVAAMSKGGYNSGGNRKEKLIEHEKKYSNLI